MARSGLVTELERRLSAQGIFFRRLSRQLRGANSTLGRAEGVVVTSREQLLITMRAAYETGTSISIVGSGHSSFHSFDPEALIVVNHDIGSNITIESERTIRVSGRSQWISVCNQSAGKSLDIPIVLSELRTTVGGTLSAGGYGESSWKSFGQIDWVRELEVILPNCETIICSPTRDAEFFGLVLAGHGALGIIESAVISVVPSEARWRVAILEFETLVCMVRFILRVSDEPGWAHITHVKGQHFRGRFICSLASASRAWPSNFDSILIGVHGEGCISSRTFETDTWHTRGYYDLRDHGGEERIWQDVVLTKSAAEAYAMWLEKQLASEEVYRRYNGRALVLAIGNLCNKPSRFEFEPIPICEDQCAIGIGVYLSVSPTDSGGSVICHHLQRKLLLKCLELGGRPYLATLLAADSRVRASYEQGLRRLKSFRHWHNFNAHSPLCKLAVTEEAPAS